jgi:arylsulfatase A
MTIDILPTLAEILKVDLPPLPIDGKSVLPLIKNEAEAQNPHEAYYFYYHRNELQAF